MKENLTISQLKNYSIFKNLDEADIDSFLKKITLKTVKKNNTIIREGDEGNSILFLIEGDISITQALTLKTNKFDNIDNREKELIRIKSEDQNFTFGEISLLSENKKRTATVKSNCQCLIGELNFSDIFKICNTNPKTGYKIMHNIACIITKQLIQSNENVLKLTTAISLIVDN